MTKISDQGPVVSDTVGCATISRVPTVLQRGLVPAPHPSPVPADNQVPDGREDYRSDVYANRHKSYGDDGPNSPVRVFYEVNRASSTAPARSSGQAPDLQDVAELNTHEAKAVIQQVACFPEPPELNITGGDPLGRPDIYVLINYAATLGLKVTVHLQPTPFPGSVQCLKAAGVQRLSLRLDQSSAGRHSELHPALGSKFHGNSDQHLSWSFEQAMQIARESRAAEIPIEIVTVVGRQNVEFLNSIGDLVEEMDADHWLLQFVAPVGYGAMDRRLSPAEYELVFAYLWDQSVLRPFKIDTVAAPHFSRFLLQQQENSLTEDVLDVFHSSPSYPEDGRGSLFVNHAGTVQPGPFLPIFCGKTPEASVVDIYNHSHTFRELRNLDLQQGKCGYCEYRVICGGCRARSYALTGNLHAPEPDCEYVPGRRVEK